MFRRNFRALYPFIKRGMDCLISAILLILLSPLLAMVFAAVKLTSKGPAIFWSDRIGLAGTMFGMPKFRTMTTCSKVISREVAGLNDIEITAFGKILRKTSLDELPQLWSVLIGHMSLIGPRPLLKNDHGMAMRNRYPDIYSVRPGMTGLAQINGRSFITTRNKSRYDMFYANRVCLWLDAKIAMKTVRVVFDTKNVM